MHVLIVGHLTIARGRRDAFVAQSFDAVRKARATSACLHFSVSPDPIEPNRVNVCERWSSRAALLAFREEGPDETDWSAVEAFHVQELNLPDEDGGERGA